MELKKMKILCVCGGRKYNNVKIIYKVLDKFYEKICNNFILIHGGAIGADSIAGNWYKQKFNIDPIVFKANWKKYGNSAGPIRNREMLNYGIDYLIAFPGNNGTNNMIKICREQNIKIYEIKL